MLAVEALNDRSQAMTPRCLNRLQAAEYCSLTPTGFDDWVRRKIVPGPIPGTRKWDRKAIDLMLAGARYVYFAKAGPFIKIGYSGRKFLDGRKSSLQTGCPFDVELLHCFIGTRADEKRFHSYFANLRVRGEWFKFEGELKEFIESPYTERAAA